MDEIVIDKDTALSPGFTSDQLAYIKVITKSNNCDESWTDNMFNSCCFFLQTD